HGGGGAAAEGALGEGDVLLRNIEGRPVEQRGDAIKASRGRSRSRPALRPSRGENAVEQLEPGPEPAERGVRDGPSTGGLALERRHRDELPAGIQLHLEQVGADPLRDTGQPGELVVEGPGVHQPAYRASGGAGVGANGPSHLRWIALHVPSCRIRWSTPLTNRTNSGCPLAIAIP